MKNIEPIGIQKTINKINLLLKGASQEIKDEINKELVALRKDMLNNKSLSALYITFGTAHNHQVQGKVFNHKTVAVIPCTHFMDGRKKAFELFGDKFAFSYPYRDIMDCPLLKDLNFITIDIEEDDDG